MPIARFKDLCLDVADAATAAAFWAPTLGLTAELGRGPDGVDRLVGAVPGQTVWLNVVPEPHTVKNRIHLDVHTGSVEELLARGATSLSAPGQFRWTVMADPEGHEFCAFVRDQPPASRLYEIGVDSTDPAAQAAWWASVWGATVHAEDGYAWIDDVPGLPCESVDFVPVPEAKTVKNRLHWDVTVDGPDGLDALVTHGATVVRRRDAEIRWDVLADPEGNEFCVFSA